MTAALDGMNYRAKDKDVCVAAYLYKGMRVALREAIVRVIICNSPFVKLDDSLRLPTLAISDTC